MYDWCYLQLADLTTSNDENCGRWTRELLIRRRITDGKTVFFSIWCPAGTSINTLITVEGRRGSIDDSFETAKNELGLTYNETRSWHGWNRHVSLVMLAFDVTTAIRHQANKSAQKNEVHYDKEPPDPIH